MPRRARRFENAAHRANRHEGRGAEDTAAREQVAALETQLRSNPFIETAARSEWTKLCRAISLGAAGQGMPNLWLEIRPRRAIAAQPQIDNRAVTLLVGVQADTRIVPNETKPDCPFPSQLEIVPQANEGTLDIAVPIDIPFTELSRLIEAQVKGKTYPEDGSGSVAVTVKQAAIAPAGERLLISLLVHATEKTSWFGLGADATLHIWGRPVLDPAQQTLRLTDIELTVESEAAFGLLGTAARAAVPSLQEALLHKASVDLKPFASNARQKIGEVIAQLQKNDDGVKVDADINDITMSEIAFDAKTLRVIIAAEGAVTATITKVPGF